MPSILDDAIISQYISQAKIDAYASDLLKWLSKYDASQFLGPGDHFAIKVEDESALEKVVEAIKPYCVDHIDLTPGLSIRKMHGRRIAVALLREPLVMGINKIFCVEIMQPQPEVEGKDVVGLDHFELINPDHSLILESLKKNAADYYIDSTNPYKKIVVAFINDRRERVKFTDKTLAEIVPQQIIDEPNRVEIILDK